MEVYEILGILRHKLNKFYLENPHLTYHDFYQTVKELPKLELYTGMTSNDLKSLMVKGVTGELDKDHNGNPIEVMYNEIINHDYKVEVIKGIDVLGKELILTLPDKIIFYYFKEPKDIIRSVQYL